MGIIGYGVNQWNVILGDMIPLLYVSSDDLVLDLPTRDKRN
jgi:hypothetical protein